MIKPLTATAPAGNRLKRRLPAELRRELRQLGYHFGWLARSLAQGRIGHAGRIGYVAAARAAADLRLALLGNSKRATCEICGWQGNSFFPYTDQGIGFWRGEICPGCAALSRHRTQLRYALRQIAASGQANLRLLEIGPWGMRRALAAIPGVSYVAVDLLPLRDCVRADATALPFADASFDLVICFSVITEIPDDRAAVREMGRVCRPGGQVILSEPMGFGPDGLPAPQTVEYSAPRADWHGARRRYGGDFCLRFSEPGLEFSADEYALRLPEREVRRFGLSRRYVFAATKEEPGR